MVEPEIAFADLGDCMDLAEDMVKHIIGHVLETCPAEMEFFNSFIDKEFSNVLTMCSILSLPCHVHRSHRSS